MTMEDGLPGQAYNRMHTFTSFEDDYDQESNSTCAQWTSCTPCLDNFGGESDDGCLWCNVPIMPDNDDCGDTSGNGTGGGGGVCLPRSRAQDRCEIGELQATCDEGVGWYVLVLTLCALMCCCCFLAMARKFAAMWHERRWIAAGGELARPLLDEEDGEEQAHEAVIRSTLVDAEGNPWRCPVCGFDNRPLCKHCDLCGIGSDFAEAYWKDKNAPKHKSRRNKRLSGPIVEDGRVGPKPQSPVAGSDLRGGNSLAPFAPGLEAGERAKDDNANDDNEGGDAGVRADEGERGEDSESELEGSESARLLASPARSFAPTVPSGLGSIQGDISSGGVTNEGDEWDREAGARVPAGEVSEKSRVTAFRLRRAGSLTERQKRARRRRIWQRVIGADAKVRWLHTLESPATAAAPPGATATSNAAASSTVPSSAYQPPPLASAGPAVSFGTRLNRASPAAGSAAAVFRYWTTTRSYRPRPPPSPTLAAISISEESLSRVASAEAVQGGDVSDAISTTATDGAGERTAESLSDVERGGGPASSPRGAARVINLGRVLGGPGSFDEDCGLQRGRGEEGGGGKGGEASRKGSAAAVVSVTSEASAFGGNESRVQRADSFGDEEMLVVCSGYYTTFLDGGGLTWDEARDGEEVARPNRLPPSATRRGPSVGDGLSSDSRADLGTSSGHNSGIGPGTGPAARRAGWADGAARRREARREAEASEAWIASTSADVAKLCEIAALPFWQKHSWFLDQLRLLQVPHGAGMEAMRIEVNRKNLLEDSFAQVSAMNTGELRRWLRVQFVGEPGVDAGGLEREWFLLTCSALFDPSTGLFAPQLGNGAFTINPSSGVANEMHLEYFRFTGRVLGKLLMEHSVAPYHLSLPILKHLLGLPIVFSDLEFADAELHRNLKWLRCNAGAAALGLDFTVTLESFGVKEVAELQPGGRDMIVNDGNKEEYLKLRLKHRVLGGIHDQLWNLMRGFYDVIPAHLISVFDYQELELLLCGIPEIDVTEWKRHSRYLGEYRRTGEEHAVVKWFWEVLSEFSEEEKARFLQFCTGTSRLPPHGFKALQSNDGSFRAFSVQSITKRESAFPRAHTCFNKLDLPIYDSKKELEECLRLCICFELTGFTID